MSPVLSAYFKMAERHPGVLLALRCGDFYEFYGEHAVSASKLLGITLTGRDDGDGHRVPMCGVPYHSVEKYVTQILMDGHKVALCEEVASEPADPAWRSFKNRMAAAGVEVPE